MKISLSSNELAMLSSATRDEIIEFLRRGAQPAPAAPPTDAEPSGLGDQYSDIAMTGVAEITLKQMQEWMEGASEKTKLALKVFADYGPVITAKQLDDAGVENLPHFQSRTTIRTRTVMRDSNAFLLGWNDWASKPRSECKYAVTPITYQALKRYFS